MNFLPHGQQHTVNEVIDAPLSDLRSATVEYYSTIFQTIGGQVSSHDVPEKENSLQQTKPGAVFSQ